MNELPPLPSTPWCSATQTQRYAPAQPDLYTADQMREYAAAAVAAERERCAKVCENIAERHLSSGRYVSVIADHSVRAGGQVDGAEECAAAIRAAPEVPR